MGNSAVTVGPAEVGEGTGGMHGDRENTVPNSSLQLGNEPSPGHPGRTPRGGPARPSGPAPPAASQPPSLLCCSFRSAFLHSLQSVRFFSAGWIQFPKSVVPLPTQKTKNKKKKTQRVSGECQPPLGDTSRWASWAPGRLLFA